MNRAQKTVFLVVHQGFAARYLLRTDILPTLLRAGVRVVALVPDDDEPALREELSTSEVVLEALRAPEKKAGQRSRTWWWTLHLRNYAIGNGHRSHALRGKADRFREKHLAGQPVEQRVFAGALHVLWRSRRLRRALLRFELRHFVEQPNAELFDRYGPGLVVTTSPGYWKPDARVLREAELRGIPSAALILSWDNPTSKGYRGANPDHVVAWSEAMAEQLVAFQDFSREQIEIAGVPHFDPYFREDGVPSREELCADLGLDPARRIVVFATGAPGYYGRDHEVAETLAAAIDGGALGDAQLVVRVHPNFPSKGVSTEPFERVAAAHPNVVVDVPRMISRRLASDMPRADSMRLGALVKHGDVLVNLLSTTTLEAFAMDTPVVLIDSKGTVYAHLQPLLRSGAAPVASTPGELVARVREALDHPEARREPRAEIVRRELGPRDGRAGERIGEILLKMLGVTPAPAPEPAVGAAT